MPSAGTGCSFRFPISILPPSRTGREERLNRGRHRFGKARAGSLHCYRHLSGGISSAEGRIERRNVDTKGVIATRGPRKVVGDGEAADPDDPGTAEGQRPQSPLFGGNSFLGKEALQLLFRGGVSGAKAVAGKPVADQQRVPNADQLKKRARRL